MNLDGAEHRPVSPMALDLLERVIILVLYGYLTARMLPSIAAGQIYNSLILVAEATVVVFVLIRRPPKSLSRRPGDWALAFIGTVTPLFFAPGKGALIAPAACALLMLGGLLLQIFAKLSLRRSFGIVAANRGVKLGGPYRLLRHPMYAGYIVTYIGALLLNPSPRNLAISAVAAGAHVARILAEERILKDDPLYRDYMSRVRYRLVPCLF